MDNKNTMVQLFGMVLVAVVTTLVVLALLYALQHSHLPLFATVS